MKDQIATLIAEVLKDLGFHGITPQVTVPDDPSHGDYTTNVAMKIATSAKRVNPMDIALQVKEHITYHVSRITKESPDHKIRKSSQKASGKQVGRNILSAIDRVEVAPPGFINLFLTEAILITHLQQVLKQKEVARTAKKIMVEFAHPNTHKTFHIGHLRNITTGESIIRLLESQGHTVIRANYQGDVGMHIAKCLYSILHQSHKPHETPATRRSLQEKVEFLGKAYAAGSKAFEEDPSAKEEIGDINKKIYTKDPEVYPLYLETRQWSLDYFEAIYKRVGSHFDRYYFESEVYEPGKELVMEALQKGIFEESDGAIIFPGATYGLHNRVFVTGEGNATYEGKELALASMELTEFGKLDRIIHVVGPEQSGFFQVTFKAEELLGIVGPGVQHHLIYGWVKLKHGKMSSRTGNVVLGSWLLDEAKKAIYDILQKSGSKYTKKEQEKIAEAAAVAAVKYAFLKVGTTSEIAFDIQESVNFQGDSGPYLQYTYARCKSVLRKAKGLVIGDLGSFGDVSLNPEERAVLRLLTHFPDTVREAADSFSPSTICTYLFKLAQAYNLFYAKHSILSTPDSSLRLALTEGTAQILASGLYLLGIETLEHM